MLLDTAFPRILGDIGNPGTFSFPTVYRRVPGARVAAVVDSGEMSGELASRFTDAVSDLVLENVDLIATSCGFLGVLQESMQRNSPVPVVSSALCLLPLLRSLYGPSRPLGVLTYDGRALSRRHFGPWFDRNLVIEGLENGIELHRVIGSDLGRLDQSKATEDAVGAAKALVGREPRVGALVLECTNLAPYRRHIAAAVSRPVFDINSAIEWFLRSL